MKKEKTVKTKSSTLEATIKEIRKKFGEDSIMMLNEKPHVDVEAISTGSIGVDMAIGIGGLPRGRVVEIYGPESSGKTTLALHVIAEAQKRGMACAFIDAEHAMDPQYAEKLGVKTDLLFISQPENGEQAMQIVDQLVRGGEIGVVVIDSVAALTPKAEIEGEIGEVKIGALARLMSQSLRVLSGSIARSKTLVIFINQIRMNIAAASSWGAPPETTSGGKALKFYASVRLEVRRKEAIKKGDEVIGIGTRVKVAKNKVGSPFRVTEVDIIYGEGISKEAEILAMGEKYGVISGYSFGDIKLGRGYESARQFLKENKNLTELIRTQVVAKINEI